MAANRIPLTDASSNNGGTWSGRGEIILGSEGTFRGLSRVAESGGTLVQFTRTDSTRDEYHVWPLALADGKTIIFTVESGSQRARAQLATTTVDGGTLHPLGITGVRALGIVANRLIYLQANGTVMAVPFDLHGLRDDGRQVRILDPFRSVAAATATRRSTCPAAARSPTFAAPCRAI